MSDYFACTQVGVEWTSPKPFGVGPTRTDYMMGDVNVGMPADAFQKCATRWYNTAQSLQYNPSGHYEYWRTTGGNVCSIAP